MALELRFKLDRNGDTAPLRVSIQSDAPFGALGAAGLGRASEIPEGKLDENGFLRALDGTPYLLPMARLGIDPEPPPHRLMVRRDDKIIANVRFSPKADTAMLDINEQLRQWGPAAIMPGTLDSLREMMNQLQDLLGSGGTGGGTGGGVSREDVQDILAQTLKEGNDGIVLTYDDAEGRLYLFNTRTAYPEWLSIQGRPATYPPSAHNHNISDVLNLDRTLIYKADLENGKLALAQAPAQTLGIHFEADSDAAMLALPAYHGHTCARSDEGGAVYFLFGKQGTASAWIQIRSASGTQVTSVNGRSGAVTLTAADVDAATAQHERRMDNPHGVTKSQIGLSNLTNDAQIPLSQKGVPNGVATLGPGGTIPPEQLPASMGGGGMAQLVTLETPTADLMAGAERSYALTMPANDIYLRVVRALGLSQTQGDALLVKLFESGDPAAPDTWADRAYEAQFGWHGRGYYTADELGAAFYLDRAEGKALRVWLKNTGTDTIQAAGLIIQGITRG